MTKRHILLTAIALLTTLIASAQTKATTEIRYVSKTGKYENDGKTWATAKKNIQDAINDLADNNLSGEVWVAAGTYSPTESTESGGSTLYMSFKVPAGITLRGGFAGTETQASERATKINTVSVPTYDANGKVVSTTTVNTDTSYVNTTTLTGDLSQTAKFTWNKTKNYWDAAFYGNCYHVVWFATNGFDSNGRAKALDTKYGYAMVEGFTIKNGNAKNNDLSGRKHNAYGGGVYMVRGSRLENCHITTCEASRDGGGIYMDGGGIVQHCYIEKCQALGIGVQNGYGGGVCIDTNTPADTIGTDKRLGIYRSVIVGSVARMGGGLAIKYSESKSKAGIDNVYPQYRAFASAVLVANNTATTEGGGVYTHGGGAMTNMTIVRNKCYGTGVISYGMTTGRAGGLYCRDHALVLNSVIWGNECPANNNIQYAATRSNTLVSPVEMKFCAVALSDYIDWSSTAGQDVFDIANYNNGDDYKNGLKVEENGTVVTYYEGTGKSPSSNDVFPNFHFPSKVAGYYADIDKGIINLSCWIPSSNSGLANKGIVSHNLNLDNNKPSPFVSQPHDIIGKAFTSRATLGAYIREFSQMTPVQTVDADGNGSDDADTDVNEWHFFVDPNAATYRTSLSHGVSWEEPAAYLGNVLHGISARTIAGISNWATAKFVIHIKEGDVDNTNSYASGNIRDVPMYVPSNVTIRGSYPKKLVGRQLRSADGSLTRNPILYPTFVRGDITSDYSLNVARMFIIHDRNTDVHDVTIDGVHVRNTNSRSSSFDVDGFDGGAYIINNGTNITIRNSIVAGCTAVRGPALYVRNGKNVKVENCIFHNNEARYKMPEGLGADTLSGVVYLEAATNEVLNTVNIDHSNLMNNVGFAVLLHSGARLNLTNSMLFANTYAPVERAYFTDPYGSFHTWLEKSPDNTGDIKRTPESLATEANGTEPFFTISHTLYDEYTTYNGQKGTLSYLLNKPNAYPRFVNGVVNTGVSSTGDVTFYGRATSFEPHNENPMTNAAARTAGNPATDPAAWGYDITSVTPRTYGGLPDVGAIENHVATTDDEGENAYLSGQKPYGSVVYVRDYHTYEGENRTDTDFSTTHADGTPRDGSSWENAINGNANYSQSQTVTVTTATGLTFQTSTIANPTYKYHIGMRSKGSAAADAIAYADSKDGTYINHDYDIENSDEFIIISAETNNNKNRYYIYNVTQQKYVHCDFDYTYNRRGEITGADIYDEEGENRIRLASSIDQYAREAYYWYIQLDGDNGYGPYYSIIPYAKRNNTTKPAWNYYNGVGNNIGLYNSSGDESKWQFITEEGTTTETTTTSLNGLQYAINTANELWETLDTPHDILVGAGKYTGNYTMKEGANLLGGYPRTGNPGDVERNISHGTGGYMTILDGNKVSNVLKQANDFTQSTLVEGFIIQNGKSTGTDYGAGVHLKRNGVIKNCLIHSNQFDVASNSAAGGGGIYINNGGMVINSIIKQNTIRNSTKILIGGAGVHSNGGTLQNSLIVENTAYTTEINVLGAGFFISEKTDLYNCTIAYNVGNNTGVDNPTGGQIGSNPCTGGVWDSKGQTNPSQFYNCIIWGNYATGTTRENFIQVGMPGFTGGAGYNNTSFHTCYSSAASSNTASDTWEDANRIFQAYMGDDPSPRSYPDFLEVCMNNEPFLRKADKTTDYSLKGDTTSTSKYCINLGSTPKALVDLNITEDIIGSPRILDCTIDKGAYEYNDSYAITPSLTTNADGKEVASFYVTPEGRGYASATDPANAACASKLQRVLDAAGRYKYLNKDKQVIVKVAQYASGEPLKYYATRTTDENDTDVRVWSIIVPRGVEVWGGYSNMFNNANDNGFYKNTVDYNGNVTATEDRRDITVNRTFFDATYLHSEEKTNVTTYHVVTFTDKVFDGNGKPYAYGDVVGSTSSWDDTKTIYLSLGTHGNVTDRAVLDGIYITGGQADLKVYESGSTKLNHNRYGGAAIVTDYAHVRNCIAMNNSGVYGGAFALTHKAMVTGCLIHRNTADYGGAIYVFEDGRSLSNDTTTIDTDNSNYDATVQTEETRFDYNMPRIVSSTIVNNDANVQGGGVHFSSTNPNVRFNSVAIWQNRSENQANVSGMYNVTRNDNQAYFTTEYYPFNYSAVQNIKPAGINNIELNNENTKGPRFVSGSNPEELAQDIDVDGPERYDNYGFFTPIDFSTLTRGGMPVEDFTSMEARGNIATNDILNTSRLVSSDNHRRFIEIGAIAVDKVIRDYQLMLRLFVVNAKDLDPDAVNATRMAAMGKDPHTYEAYYAQEGSSFANPFTDLQDALDYIYQKRGWRTDNMKNGDVTGAVDPVDIKENANNMQFEIWLGPGEYVPSIDLTGKHNHTAGFTFLIPEGVSLIGGFDPTFACDSAGTRQTNTNDMIHILGGHQFAKYNAPGADWAQGNYLLSNNAEPMYKKDANGDPLLDSNGDKQLQDFYDIEYNDGGVTKTYRIHHVPRLKAYNQRELADINANSVIEAWEFAKQTILKGKIEGENNKGVNHIVTIVPNESYTGALPLTKGPATTLSESDPNYGYKPQEVGQIISLDGLTFTGGNAYGYTPNTVDDDHKMKYFHGGAILVDGNRYFNYYNKLLEKNNVATNVDAIFRQPTYMHPRQIASAGYREIPLMINACKFEDNHAGYGGAISSNTTLDLMNSSFEHNKSTSGKDMVDFDGIANPIEVTYPGVGGAIYASYQVTGINCMFENNEATADRPEADRPEADRHIEEYHILSEQIYAAKNGTTATPRRLYTGGGGAVFASRRAQFHFMNCNFVRNMAMAYPAIFTSNPNYQYQLTKPNLTLKDYNQAFNCIFWGNDLNPVVVNGSHGTEEDKRNHLFVLGKAVNYGPSDRYKDGVLQTYTLGITKEYTAMNMEELDREETVDGKLGYTEQLWFCAYENNKAKTPNNSLDLRDITFHPRVHVKTHIITEIERLMKEANAKLPDGDPAKLSDAAIAANAVAAYQNCNILLDSINNSNEGPNFVNPSQKAGYEGYEESADWSPARLNNMTDNGWGKIKQKTSLDNAENLYGTTFMTYDGAPGASTDFPLPNYPLGRTSDYGGNTKYSAEAIGTYVIDGAYSAIRYMQGNEKFQETMPIGAERYMYTNYTDNSGNRVPLYRISFDPNPSHNQTYVDIGVYEYHHTQLNYTTEADAVDVLWVSGTEKPDNGLPDGSDWSQPTSDLQRAIETLLSSRNDHRKEIRLMDGTYTPFYTIDGNLSFYINTMAQNGTVLLDYKYVKDADGNYVIEVINGEKQLQEGLGVKSLTIKGGYSKDLNGVRNVELYPAIIKQQARTDGTSTRWNHLFYIVDPTQRYGFKSESGYSESNNYGHIKAGIDTLQTIPIEFDGVKIINDQALPGTKGAAIYYANLSDTLKNAQANLPDNETLQKQTQIYSNPINVSTKYTEIKNAAGIVTGYDHNYTTVENPAKLFISKSEIFGSGNADEPGNTQSAVYLGDNHGHAIVYNTVFHSNYGKPIEAQCRALTVNNTYALNSGFLELLGTNSMIHNSVLWRNNPTDNTDPIDATTYSKQFTLAGFGDSNNASAIYNDATKTLLSYNTYTDGPTESTDYSTTGDLTQKVAGKNYNTTLAYSNEDFMLGPNFIKPDGDTIANRNFNINPSLRLMNKGLDQHYDTLQVVDREAENSALKDFSNISTLYDMAINATYTEDAASAPRIVGSIDIGAYEYQKELRRVIYVDPLRESDTGESWEHPMGYGDIQNAIDLAALYHSNNDDEQTFVFVKGAGRTNKDFHTGEEVTLRNGVSIIGGIDKNVTITAKTTQAVVNGKETTIYSDENIRDFIRDLSEYSEGHVGPNTSHTSISGIKTSKYTIYNTSLDNPTYKNDPSKTRLYPITSYIMGFHVTPNGSGELTAPVIDVDPQVAKDDTGKPKVGLLMLAVYDNKMKKTGVADDVSAVKIKNAIVYGSLFRDNDAGMLSDGTTERPVIMLDEGAWAVNISAQGKTATKALGEWKSPYNGRGIYGNLKTERDHRIVNSIVNYDGQDPTITTGAHKRITEQTKLTLSGHNYRRSDRNMYFQLSAGSKHINEIPISFVDENDLGNSFLPENLRYFVNYRGDRDMLGNPRLLTLLSEEKALEKGSKYLLDRGCYETWYVNDAVVHTSRTTPNKDHYWPGKKHFAPHTGSVVYINGGSSLVCGVTFQPGFLLMKEGANLYGNGQNVLVSYLAVEREINQKGSVVSLPFPMNYSTQTDTDGQYITGVARPYYEGADGSKGVRLEGGGILRLATDNGTKIFDYDGSKRSDIDYDFSATNGDAWTDLTLVKGDTRKKANEGVLLIPAADVVSGSDGLYKDTDGDDIIDADSESKLIYRFTAQGEKWEDTIYVEYADRMYKDVVLGHYDDTDIDGGTTIKLPTDTLPGSNGTYIPGADFTPQENMGWNCIGIPYLVSDYKPFNEAAGTVKKNAYAYAAGEEHHYNMQVPHVLWLYYDGTVTPDGSTVDGNGGFYSVPSWENVETVEGGKTVNSWHIPYDASNKPTDTPRLWMSEGFFVQAATVTGNERLRFYRPLPPSTDGASPAPRRANKRYYSGGADIKNNLVSDIAISVHRRTVNVSGLRGGENIAIYDTAGRLYLSDTASAPLDNSVGTTEWTTTLPSSGIYIIAVDGVRKKVGVK